MSLVTGILTQEGVVIATDKAIFSPTSIRECEGKIAKIKQFPVFTALAGDVHEIDRFEIRLNSYIQKYIEDEEFSVDALENIILSKKAQEMGDFTSIGGILASTDRKSSNLYYLVIEKRDNGSPIAFGKAIKFHCSGIGRELGSSFLLEYLTKGKTLPERNTAARMLAVANYAVSKINKAVSPTIEIIALEKGKLGKLDNVSKFKLLREAITIWKCWCYWFKITSIHPNISEKFITWVFNENYEEEYKSVRKRGNLAIIIDDMYSKQERRYAHLLEALRESEMEVEVISKINKIKDILMNKSQQLGMIILDKRLKGKLTPSLKIIEFIKDNMYHIPIILVARRISERQLSRFIEFGIDALLLKDDFPNKEKVHEVLSYIKSEKELLWQWDKLF